MERAETVREGFREQARWCERLGSRFTARLCAVLAETLDPATRLGARLLAWPGDPMTDALALRLCGGLHALVRAGDAPSLASLYPPTPLPSEDALRAEDRVGVERLGQHRAEPGGERRAEPLAPARLLAKALANRLGALHSGSQRRAQPGRGGDDTVGDRL